MRGVISGLPDLVKLDEDPPDKDVCDREFNLAPNLPGDSPKLPPKLSVFRPKVIGLAPSGDPSSSNVRPITTREDEFISRERKEESSDNINHKSR